MQFEVNLKVALLFSVKICRFIFYSNINVDVDISKGIFIKYENAE